MNRGDKYRPVVTVLKVKKTSCDLRGSLTKRGAVPY